MSDFSLGQCRSLILSWLVVSLVLAAQCFSGTNGQAPSGTIRGNIPKSFDYGEYVAKYGKVYTEVETMNKARLFFARTVAIFKHNMLFVSHKVGHFLKQSEYIDMTKSEIRSTFKSGVGGLEMVDEAKKNPDQPADQALSVRLLKAQRREETDSEMAPSGGPSNFRKPVVDFLSPDDDDDSDKPADIKQIAGRNLLRGADLVQLDLLSSPSGGLIQVSDPSERARTLHGIKYSPVVTPNNKNYDPALMPSLGLADTMEKMGDNYAKYMMDDFTGLALEPYPEPASVEKQRVAPSTKQSTLSAFIQSVKSIYNFFDIDEEAEIDDWEEDGEEEEEKEEAANGEQQHQEKQRVQVLKRQEEATGESKTTGSDHNVPEHEAQERQRAAERKRRMEEGGAVNKMAKRTRTDDYVMANDTAKEPPIEFDIDWRVTGCISRVRSQADCNSCYAFATLNLMEFFYCRQMNTYTEFSSQYLIDCGSKAKLNGCTGGKISLVGVFIANYGLQLEAHYPYVARENSCPFDELEYAEGRPYPLKPSVKSWRMFPEMAAWYKWLPRKPAIVGINMPGDFLAYGGGIHDGSDCSPGMAHAMLLVGSGSQDGQEFWLLKNSFSDKWGEQGYFRLSKRAPLRCFNSIVVVSVDFGKPAS